MMIGIHVSSQDEIMISFDGKKYPFDDPDVQKFMKLWDEEMEIQKKQKELILKLLKKCISKITKIRDGKSIFCEKITLDEPIILDKKCIFPELIPIIKSFQKGDITKCPNCKKNDAVLFYALIGNIWHPRYGCLKCGKIW